LPPFEYLGEYVTLPEWQQGITPRYGIAPEANYLDPCCPNPSQCAGVLAFAILCGWQARRFVLAQSA
jgi:hypothetical protein